MQTISTKYLGPTNTRGSRVVAIASGNRAFRTWVSAGMSRSDNEPHEEAARKLAGKLEWKGEMIGGHTKDGMVWVFVDPVSPRITL